MEFLKIPGRRKLFLLLRKLVFCQPFNFRTQNERRQALLVTTAVIFFLCLFVIFLLRLSQHETPVEDWKRISPQVYVYSAYHEKRTSLVNSVRIIALTQSGNTDYKTNILCTLKYRNYSHIQVVIAEHVKVEGSALEGDASLVYSPAFIICNGDPQLLPYKVGLRTVGKREVFWLPVKHARKRRRSEMVASIAACVKSPQGTINDLRMAEFIAYYRTIGVSHFVFYNQTMANKLRAVLKAVDISSKGFRFLSWSGQAVELSFKKAEQALVYDCALRSRDRADYLLVLDMSEFLVLRDIPSLKYLIENHQNTDAFVFNEVEFCVKEDTPSGKHMMMLQRGHRNNKMVSKKRKISVLTNINWFLNLAGNLTPSYYSVEPYNAVLHRYSDDACSSNDVFDSSAFVMAGKVLRSDIVNSWRSMFTF